MHVFYVHFVTTATAKGCSKSCSSPHAWVPDTDTVYSKVLGVLGGPCSSKRSRADTHQNFTGLMIPIVPPLHCSLLGLSLLNSNYCTRLSFRIADVTSSPI